MVITPDGYLIGRCQGDLAFKAFIGASDDLLLNIHGDEIGYVVSRVAEITRQS